MRHATLLAALLLLGGCAAGLPERPPDTAVSHRLPAAGTTGDQTGVKLLVDAEEAFAARLALIDAAEHTIDAQYYIWSGDAAGYTIISRIVAAADRGVRVRLLIDDFDFYGNDQRVAGLQAHPNVEIHTFNPFRARVRLNIIGRMLDLVIGAARLNHRMHNKILASDNRYAIVGGRNLADEYFGVDPEYSHRDMDVLLSGAAVDQVSLSFDDYWNSNWAVPVVALGTEEAPVRIARPEHDAPELVQRLLGYDVSGYLDEVLPGLIWAPVEVVVDPPEKSTLERGEGSPVRDRLIELADTLDRELLIENAYFVPGEVGVANVADLVQRGVRVAVLTNSLASNDSGVSHSGYKKYRKPLLEGGVELYELRADGQFRDSFSLNPPVAHLGLHTKAAVFDRRVGVVGSLNLDPRSAFINTEIAVVVHNAEFAAGLAARMEGAMQRTNSWQLQLDTRGRLEWRAQEVRSSEPPSSFGKRLTSLVFGLLPVENQL